MPNILQYKEKKINKDKLVRITTIPIALKVALKNQLRFMSDYFDIIAVASDGKELSELSIQEGVRTKAINLTRKITPIQDIQSLINMILFLIKEKPMIVHTETPKAGLIGMLAAKLCNIPIRLHTVAGLPLMEATKIKQKVLIIVEKIVYKCSTHIYINSSGLKEYIKQNNLTTPSKLSVIGHGSSNGIDTTYFKRTPYITGQSEDLKQTYQLSNTTVFSFIGRIVKDKGINELLEVFETLTQSHQKIKLLLVGELEQYLNPISNQSMTILKKNPHIIQTGFKEDVRPYLALSNYLVLPTYREGFPNVLLQAGAMEIPSITTNINGCNEIIKDKYNGFLIKPKNKIELFKCMENVIKDPTLEKKLAQNCRKEITKKYNQKSFFNMLLNEYQRHIENYK